MKQCRSRPCIKNKKKPRRGAERRCKQQQCDRRWNLSGLHKRKGSISNSIAIQIACRWKSTESGRMCTQRRLLDWERDSDIGDRQTTTTKKKSILEALWRSDYSSIKNVCRRKESYDSHDKRTPPFLVDWRLTTLPLQHNQELDWIQENTTQLFNRSNVSGNWFDWF